MQNTRSLKHGYVSILRCRTWCVWPERASLKSGAFFVRFKTVDEKVALRYFLVSYAGRPRPELSPAKPLGNDKGPLFWRGGMESGYWVGQSFVKAPEDETTISIHYEGPYEGDIDIQIHIEAEAEIPLTQLAEIASSLSLPVLSFLNITLGEFLIPVGPIQIRKLTESSAGWQIPSTVILSVRRRLTLGEELLASSLKRYTQVMLRPDLRTSLEIYAGYFHQTSVVARFLTLMMVLEALAPVTMKPQFALSILDKWRSEIAGLKAGLGDGSDELAALEAIERDLDFRREASVSSRIRSFVLTTLGAVGNPDAENIARRALQVYSKRGTLLHEGTLDSAEELDKAERDAKEIIDVVHKAKIDLESRDVPAA